MKQNINFSAFVDTFRAYDRYDQFGYDALKLLFDYFEEYETSCNTEIELDVISICCEYYLDDYSDIAENYGIDISEEEEEEDKKQIVIDYIIENSVFVGECKDGIVYATFWKLRILCYWFTLWRIVVVVFLFFYLRGKNGKRKFTFYRC